MQSGENKSDNSKLCSNQALWALKNLFELKKHPILHIESLKTFKIFSGIKLSGI